MKNADKAFPPSGLVPQIAFEKLTFPSDKLTIATIRRGHPTDFDTLGVNFFDGERMGKKDWPQESLAEMIHIERYIAQQTYVAVVQGQRTIGLVGSPSEDDQGFVEDVTAQYVRYGLANGPNEARVLIESIQSQAIKQAEQFKQMVNGRSR